MCILKKIKFYGGYLMKSRCKLKAYRCLSVALVITMVLTSVLTASADSSSNSSSSDTSSSNSSSSGSSSGSASSATTGTTVKIAAKPISQVISELDKSIFEDKYPYFKYIEQNKSKKDSINKKSVVINSSNITIIKGDGFEVLKSYADKDNVIKTGENGSVSFKFNVETSGFYNIVFSYIPLIDNKNEYQIQRKLLINNTLQFFECSTVIFDRTFTSKTDKKIYDKLNNQIKPTQSELFKWTDIQFKDRVGTNDGLYRVYFEKGENTMELVSLRESMALSQIVLCESTNTPTYNQLKNNYTAPSDVFIKTQGEDADFVNDVLLQPSIDKTSSLTEPYDAYNIRYNIMGGLNFKQPGQKIEWNVNVKEAGMYNISFRAKQSAKRDLSAFVTVKVNDQIPFKECENIELKYSDNWRKLTVGNDDNIMKVPLKAGENKITLELSAYTNANIANEIETSILRLSSCYKQILMLTGSEPDKNRDYQFKNTIPDVLQVFRFEGQRLYNLLNLLEKTTGQKGSDSVLIENLARQITDMSKNPYSIAERLDTFSNNLSAMATWITTIKDISVDVDYLVINSDNKVNQIPELNDSFFSSIKKELTEFFATFIFDYSSIGGVDANKKKIKVWIGSGRDQALIIKNLSNADFTPKNNISVDIQLVNNVMLMPAIMAGTAPDIALQQGNIVQPGSQGIMNQVGTLAVEWGLRGALYPLNSFADMNQVLTKRFSKSSYEPLGYEGVYYALPETQSFPMLFYRKDVLKQLGLSIPKTWDDVQAMIPILQNNHMQFGFNFDFVNFNTLLMQNGGKLYDDNYSKVALDSNNALDSFTKFTDLVTVYKLPLMFDFNNRFRTGETPIGISDFSTYNVLQVLAPEIDGLWGFAEVPGTLKADGTIDNTVVGMPATTCFITKASKNPQESWVFLKWWTSTDIQSQYSREIESVLGGSGRYSSANNDAFANLPWTHDDLITLQKQMSKTKEIPQIIGGYMVVRQFDNAFRAVVLSSNNSVYSNGQDARSSILKYVDFMNQELQVKKKEFKMINNK
jgi:ABC-type glycerol-3-phosphate transport system substrate-binding protein